ncbi:MAG TPA: hypothetical protein VGB48_02825 [Allosphingosinicella sp.]|jgi:uncharacterized protein (DUF58 family)
MSSDTWFLGVFALLLTGLALRTLLIGQVTVARRIERRVEPGAYWLAIGCNLVAAGLFLWSWTRSLSGDPEAGVQPAFLFGPYFVYLLLEGLRAGEFRWGNNHFPRQGRAGAYWTLLLLTFLIAAFFIGAAIYI